MQRLMQLWIQTFGWGGIKYVSQYHMFISLLKGPTSMAKLGGGKMSEYKTVACCQLSPKNTNTNNAI